jgi:hypothetical protein
LRGLQLILRESGGNQTVSLSRFSWTSDDAHVANF